MTGRWWWRTAAAQGTVLRDRCRRAAAARVVVLRDRRERTAAARIAGLCARRRRTAVARGAGPRDRWRRAAVARGAGLRDRLMGPGGRADVGSALVEFLGVTLVLLVPVVYLVLVLGRVQAATFAVEGAAREAARAFVLADDAGQGEARAITAVGVALADQGFDDDPAAALRMRCSAEPCLTPGAEVVAAVEVRVPLPFVPAFVRDVVPLEVPVSAERTAPVDRYRAAR